MTFEEKYAAKGRKLDELKAKLEAAIDSRKLAVEQKCEKLDAALDEFDAALDDQIVKQFDTLDAQVEKQFDTMDKCAENLEAQIDKQYKTLDDQLKTQCDTLDAQINKQYDTLDAEVVKQCDTMERRVEMLDAQVKKQADTFDAQVEKQFDTMDKRAAELDAKVEEGAAKVKAAFTLDKATAEAVANESTRIDDIQTGTAEQVARAKGDVAMAKENARLLHERRDAKCNDVLLRADMKVKAAKEKVAERKEEIDKAAEEQWIMDLLDYAAGCYEMAYAWAVEAEYTLMEAACEIDYYLEKFGPKE